jgi:hypothetical protein
VILKGGKGRLCDTERWNGAIPGLLGGGGDTVGCSCVFLDNVCSRNLGRVTVNNKQSGIQFIIAV